MRVLQANINFFLGTVLLASTGLFACVLIWNAAEVENPVSNALLSTIPLEAQ